jgi:hypothetical protein
MWWLDGHIFGGERCGTDSGFIFRESRFGNLRSCVGQLDGEDLSVGVCAVVSLPRETAARAVFTSHPSHEARRMGHPNDRSVGDLRTVDTLLG